MAAFAAAQSAAIDLPRSPKPLLLWAIAVAGLGAAGITTKPEEYERRVIGFFDRALLQRTSSERSTP